MHRRDPDPRVTGVVLVALGLILFGQQFVEGLSVAILFFALGGVFLAVYLTRRMPGYLIPGAIMLGLALGALGEEADLGIGDPWWVGLGIGFLAIYGIGRLVEGRSPWWPLIPGGVLLFNGLAPGSYFAERFFDIGWPLVLVVIGIGILVRRRRSASPAANDD